MAIYKWMAALGRPMSKDKLQVKGVFQEEGLLDLFLGVYNS